jgi:hypothetical protein
MIRAALSKAGSTSPVAMTVCIPTPGPGCS